MPPGVPQIEPPIVWQCPEVASQQPFGQLHPQEPLTGGALVLLQMQTPAMHSVPDGQMRLPRLQAHRPFTSASPVPVQRQTPPWQVAPVGQSEQSPPGTPQIEPTIVRHRPVSGSQQPPGHWPEVHRQVPLAGASPLFVQMHWPLWHAAPAGQTAQVPPESPQAAFELPGKQPPVTEAQQTEQEMLVQIQLSPTQNIPSGHVPGHFPTAVW
jgi:hypothetical protein